MDRRPANDLIDLYSRWGIDVNEGEAFAHFKHRFEVALGIYERWDHVAEGAVLRRLAIRRGYPTQATKIGQVLAVTRDLKDFLVTAQLLFWAISDADEASLYGISADPFAKALEEARDHSPMIDFLILYTDTG